MDVRADQSSYRRPKCLLPIWPLLRRVPSLDDAPWAQVATVVVRIFYVRRSKGTATAYASKLAPTGRGPISKTVGTLADLFPAKAGPTNRPREHVGPASAGKLLILIFIHITPRRRHSRLGCRLNAGFAEWAEPQGCGESAVRTWMSVRRGPTEQDRSEGTRRSRAQPGAGTLGCSLKQRGGCFSK
jgi:hypothetical protein